MILSVRDLEPTLGLSIPWGSSFLAAWFPKLVFCDSVFIEFLWVPTTNSVGTGLRDFNRILRILFSSAKIPKPIELRENSRSSTGV